MSFLADAPLGHVRRFGIFLPVISSQRTTRLRGHNLMEAPVNRYLAGASPIQAKAMNAVRFTIG